MTIATEETCLLSNSSIVDDIEQQQQQALKSNNKKQSNRRNLFHLHSQIVTNSFVVNVIAYSALAISVLLGLIFVLTSLENQEESIGSKDSLLHSIWYGHPHQQDDSWWDSSKDYAGSWFKRHHHSDHDNDHDDWDHFHKWNVDGNVSEHYHSSSYEYNSDGTINGTKRSYTDRETWTIKNKNGTVTHYERWTDENGIVHTNSSTS